MIPALTAIPHIGKAIATDLLALGSGQLMI
jgi:hypothetical protein